MAAGSVIVKIRMVLDGEESIDWCGDGRDVVSRERFMSTPSGEELHLLSLCVDVLGVGVYESGRRCHR